MNTNKLTRSFILVVPVIIFLVNAVVLLITTGLRDLVWFAFSWHSYWNLIDEWHQCEIDADNFIRYWKTGSS